MKKIIRVVLLPIIFIALISLLNTASITLLGLGIVDLTPTCTDCSRQVHNVMVHNIILVVLPVISLLATFLIDRIVLRRLLK